MFYHDLREGPHFHDVLELFVHVSQCELTLLDFLHQLLVVVQFQLIYLQTKLVLYLV